MRSRRFSGPLAVLPGGRLLRAGKGSVGVWNLDDLETHQNGSLIGGAHRGEYYEEDPWDDRNPSEVEDSKGSEPHATLALTDENFTPYVWKRQVSTGHMLCAQDRVEARTLGVVSVDLEYGGHRVARYFGHGGPVDDLSKWCIWVRGRFDTVTKAGETRRLRVWPGCFNPGLRDRNVWSGLRER